MRQLIFRIEIEPQAKQSVRGGKKFYTDPKKKAYQDAIAWLIREKASGAQPFQKYAIVEIDFHFESPKKLTDKNSVQIVPDRYKTTKPDIDNLLKPVFDALTESQIISDDNIIIGVTAKKFWNKYPHIAISIEGE